MKMASDFNMASGNIDLKPPINYTKIWEDSGAYPWKGEHLQAASALLIHHSDPPPNIGSTPWTKLYVWVITDTL